MEAEVRATAIVDVQALELVGRARDHKAALSSAQIIDYGSHASCNIAGRILDRYSELISLVHQQGFRVGSEGGSGLHVGSRRAGRHPIPLDERKVGRLQAVKVAGREAGGAFHAVNMQGGAPVGLITTDLRDKGREAGRIELHLQEG